MKITNLMSHQILRPAVRGTRRPSIMVSAIYAIILCGALCLSSQLLAQMHYQQIVSADARGSTRAQSSNATNQPLINAQRGQTASQTSNGKAAKATTTPAVAGANAASSVSQTCVPMSPGAPSALNLAGTSGLQQQVDAPNQYQIYGNSSAALRAQIARCAPKNGESAEFVADTNYEITWQYDYSQDAGSCHISRVSVGVHVGQTMPLWRPTAAAPTALRTSWAGFMSALTTHENGHTALDIQYAQQLLSDLTKYPTVPCSQLEPAITSLTDTDMARLQQANNDYDQTTNHGATQGAVLPH